MEKICYPYSFDVSMNDKCFSEYILTSLEYFLFIFIISAENWLRSNKLTNSYSKRFRIILLFLISISFVQLSLFLFFKPIDTVSLAEFIMLGLQLILWILVFYSYNFHYSLVEFGLTSQKTLKIFFFSRIFSSIYAVITYFTLFDTQNYILLDFFKFLSIFTTFLLILFSFPQKKGQGVLHQS